MQDSETTWLTPETQRRLTEELAELETTGRAKMSERIAEARSHGDIRENADYDAAKNEQGLMEARIRKLRHLLDNAELRTPSADRVEIGCLVTVTDEDGDITDYFVAPSENKLAGTALASPESPFGSALLGAAPGDYVTFEAPGGTFKYQVVAVRPFDG